MHPESVSLSADRGGGEGGSPPAADAAVRLPRGGGRRALVGLALVAALGAGVLYGYRLHRDHWFPYGPVKALLGKPEPTVWARRWNDAGRASQLAQRDAVGSLLQLPYLRGYNPASGKEGVVAFDPARAYPGWNLCVSAHAPEAWLMALDGTVRHRWILDARRVWPGRKIDPERREDDQYWRRAHLLAGGDLLVIWEYIGIMRIDSRSQLKWALAIGANHDLAVDPDGAIYVLTHEKKVLPEVNPSKPVFEDFVAVLTPEGRLVRKISLFRAFRTSDYAAVLGNMASVGDLFHGNALQWLDGSLSSRAPAFRRGNLLVSISALGVVAVLDPQQGKIVWALSGPWRGQHSARLLETGRLLVFDNFGSMRSNASRVLEVDPSTQEIPWRYGESPGEEFFSETGGFVRRLPNGNTLITISDEGRSREVTSAHEVVWEYVSPHRAGEHQELVATLHQVERLPENLPVEQWAPKEAAGSKPPR